MFCNFYFVLDKPLVLFVCWLGWVLFMVLFVLFPVDNEKDNIFVLVDHLFLLQHLVVVELSAVARLLPLGVETPAQVEHQ